MNKLDKVMWGVIGAGAVCEKKSMPAMNKISHSSVKTVMRRNAEACKDFAKRHHVPNWTTNSQTLFDDPDINAIYIATPPNTHASYAKKAAYAGKAVYVEKPMARNYDECLEMIKVCNEADVPLFVAYYRRALPHFLRVKELLTQSAFGKVTGVEIQFNRSLRQNDINNDNNWRVHPEISGGGHFYDLSSHQLDLIDFLFGPILNVKGKTENMSGYYKPADKVYAEFDLRDNIKGWGNWNFASTESDVKDEIRLYGEEGDLHFSTFAHARLVGRSKFGEIKEEISLPDHIQQPLITTIVKELRGEGRCPSRGETAARTSKIMDEICK
jgi:predicted dehydrogenase